MNTIPVTTHLASFVRGLIKQDARASCYEAATMSCHDWRNIAEYIDKVRKEVADGGWRTRHFSQDNLVVDYIILLDTMLDMMPNDAHDYVAPIRAELCKAHAVLIAQDGSHAAHHSLAKFEAEWVSACESWNRMWDALTAASSCYRKDVAEYAKGR